ncbi:choice-of-anchor tandem repeat GloVer-containing protein [Paraburkholderia hospita]|jgi:uncharacterized repeat protein (TIGR03803 family)|uniref:choice-of-anchor tandem repeat GloVer-containing protein n=1 Tax=Paraburkholderia hospita TaxID=169430 RepID=UPI000DEF5C43|nr:choice-of-anchor tandem repeat GloVer-containing protein [Paraburkholderia hospita]AXF01725.1 hypothetical protein CUJ88_25190 [Paraburkholderia hospita]
MKIKQMKKFRTASALVAIATFLAACGAGGGSGATGSAGSTGGQGGGSTGQTSTPTASGGLFTTLYQFGLNTTDPTQGKYLTQASDGSFYGASRSGGANAMGAIFHYGQNTLTVLYSFSANVYPAAGRCSPGMQDSTCSQVGPDAQVPSGRLSFDAAGNLFGLSMSGGAQVLGSGPSPVNDFSNGTIYSLPPSGGHDSVLQSFHSTANSNTGAIWPVGSLAAAPDGTLYGVTQTGGTGNTGAVFLYNPNTTVFSTVYSFGATGSGDPAQPNSGLILGPDGNLWGTTYVGGANGNGAVYKLTPGGTAVTVVYSFGPSSGTDGANPTAALIIGSDGALYGSTRYGGANGTGTIFRITTGGSYSQLHSFGVAGSGDGVNPIDAMVAGLNGRLYGTTLAGGANNLGSIFTMTNSGTIVILYSFTGGNDGQAPGGLALDSQMGNLYGTTTARGQYGGGTLFMMTP